jgi:hypothetical protein
VTVPTEKERKPVVVPRETRQPAAQKPFSMKPGEKQKSVREEMEEQEKSRVQRKSTAQPPVKVPAPSPYQRGTASEGLKQRSQQPSKALGRPEPAVKPQPARPAQPQQKVQTQKVRPEKPEPEDQGQGERGRPQGLEDLGKERRK